MADPILRLADSQGTTLSVNDNWQDAQASETGQTGLAPTNALESALLVTLPGSYTSFCPMRTAGPGIGLLEIYHFINPQSRLSR